MKRYFTIIMMFLLLTGCAGRNDDMSRALHFREKLLEQRGCCFTCRITADYGTVLYTFDLACEADSRGTVSFTVLSPESISGIEGQIKADGGKIKFDDDLLGFPLLSEELPTPLSAPWLLISSLRNGYIRTFDTQQGNMVLTIAQTYEDDSLHTRIQFDRNEMPSTCEVIWKGHRILSMQIDGFRYL